VEEDAAEVGEGDRPVVADLVHSHARCNRSRGPCNRVRNHNHARNRVRSHNHARNRVRSHNHGPCNHVRSRSLGPCSPVPCSLGRGRSRILGRCRLRSRGLVRSRPSRFPLPVSRFPFARLLGVGRWA